MRRLAVFGLLAAIACGGKADPGPTTGGGAIPAAADAAVAPAVAADAGAPVVTLTDDECAEMADHMIDVQLEAMKRAGQDLPQPEQIDEIRRGIKADFVPGCSGKLSREVFDCWMAADSKTAFEACAGGPAPPQD